VTSPHPSHFLRVLDDGLPAQPARMTPGSVVPIAVWNGPSFGAVMYLEDCEHDSFCGTDEHYLMMSYAYRRVRDGWELPRGGGGTEWPVGGSTAVPFAPREVLFGDCGPHGSLPGWTCWIVDGVAGAAARWVELVEGTDTTRRDIGPSGAFIVVLEGSGPATVRVLDADKGVLDLYVVQRSA
jgi:hypothetical protein